VGDWPENSEVDQQPPIPPPPAFEPEVRVTEPPLPHPPSRFWTPSAPLPSSSEAELEQASVSRAWRALVTAGSAMLILLVTGLLIAVTSSEHPSRASGATLALSFTEGNTSRFHLTYSLTATMSTETGINQSFRISIEERVSLRVVSIDADGVATVNATIDKAKAEANGASYPVPRATTRLRVSKDGRILSSGGLALSTGGSGSGSVLPSMDQYLPLLPERKVLPGDRWSKDFAVPFPLGKGSLRYQTDNQLLRYETLAGTRAAVIQSDILVPMKLTMDPLKFLEAAGGDLSQVPPGFDAKLRLRGSMSGVETSWYDLAGKKALKSTMHGSMDMRMSFTGSGAGDVPEIRFLGTFDGSFESLP
jgi:hypothetical protein